MRFLQPCLLLLLRSGEAHGYGLLTELERFGFDPEQVDPTLVYRALREMETVGWVQSKPDDRSLGPPRRVLSLTAEGERQLASWIEDLRRTQAEIDRLLEAYGENMPGEGP
jgi:DNA-binding PadR family transcriptional regulator